MASRSLLFFFYIPLGLSFLFSGGFSSRASAQESTKIYSRHSENDSDRPYHRDRLDSNWNQRGRSVPPGESAAGLRFRAYRQKMNMRALRANASYATRQSKLALG